MGTNTQQRQRQSQPLVSFQRLSTCDVCKNLLTRRDDFHIQESVKYILCVPVSLVCPHQEKKQDKERIKSERSKFVLELKRRLSALRNTEGGAVLVHIEGLNEDDKYLDYFNELVDDKLNDMIDDGSLFTDIYKKFWLSVANCEGVNVSGVVTIIVHPTDIVSTSQFNTKIPLDNKIIDPQNNTIFNYLKVKGSFSSKPAKFRGLNNIQEGRSIQVKSGFSSSHTSFTTSEIVDCLLSEHRLREYVSAFSKVHEGGSYYFGISEENKDYGTYRTKIYEADGIKLQHPYFYKETEAELEKRIQDHIGNGTVILRCDGQILCTAKDTVKLKLHKLESWKFVIEVAVGPVAGLLFFDREGPESYEATDDNTLRRLSIKEWFGRFYGKIGREDLTDVDRRGLTCRCPLLKQVGNSLEEIEHFVLGTDDVAIFPRYNKRTATKPKKNIADRICERPTKTFAYVARCLASAANIQPKYAGLDSVLFDVILISCDQPTVVFSVLRDHSQRNKAASYNLSLVKGIVPSIRRFTDERFSVVFGLLDESDIESTEVFNFALKNITHKTSVMCTPDSLSMPERKYKKIVRAFLFSVANTKWISIEKENKKEETLYFLTKEQFEILFENIDRHEVHVKTSFSSGGKVLLLELLRRLEILGPTLLLSDNEKLVEFARFNKICSMVFTTLELKHEMGYSRLDQVKSVVTDKVHDINHLTEFFTGAERLWKFQTENQDKTGRFLTDTFLECPVCVEHFNQTDRRPRVLHSCLHAFCTQCLQYLLENGENRQIICPLCRQVQVVESVDKLPVEIIRDKLIDYIQLKQKRVRMCTDCPDKNTAVYKCKECKATLCVECKMAHRRIRLGKEHHISPLLPYHEKDTTTRKDIHETPMCFLHTGYPVIYFCLQCETPCCNICKHGTHIDHKMITVQETIDSEVNQIDKTFEKHEGGLFHAAKQEDMKSSAIVEVQNYPKDATDDKIMFYFENEQRAGGCEIEMISRNDETGVILLKFDRPEVADMVVVRDHILSGRRLKVQHPFQPKQPERAHQDHNSKRHQFPESSSVQNHRPAPRGNLYGTLGGYPQHIGQTANPGQAPHHPGQYEFHSPSPQGHPMPFQGRRPGLSLHPPHCGEDVRTGSPHQPPSYGASQPYQSPDHPGYQQFLMGYANQPHIPAQFGLGFQGYLHVPEPHQHHGQGSAGWYASQKGPTGPRQHFQPGDDQHHSPRAQTPVSETKDLPTASDPLKTVCVKGVKKNTSEDTLILYFENKRRSGGGDIENLDMKKDGSAFITFCEHTVAARVANRQHALLGKTLVVRQSVPQVMYKDKVLLVGVPEQATEEALTNFLEVKTNVDVDSYLYGEEEGEILVSFKEAFEDFLKLSASIKKKPFLKTTLGVRKVAQTDSITVRNLPDMVTEDQVTMYFENNKRSGGGDVVAVILNDSEKFAVVRFKDTSVAATVCKREHNLGKSKVDVSLHFECLGESGGTIEQPCTKVPDPEHFKDLEEYKLKFLGANGPVFDKIKAVIENLHGKLDMCLTNRLITVSPTYTKDDKEAKSITKTWTEDVRKFVTEELEAISTQKIDVNSEIWPDVEPKMNEFRRTSDVHVFTEEHNWLIVVAGSKEKVNETGEKVNIIVKNVQAESDRKKNQIRHKNQFNPWKLRVVVEKGIISNTEYLKVNCDMTSGEVELTGPKEEVQNAVFALFEAINNVSEETSTKFTPDQVELLRRPNVLLYLEKKQKSQNRPNTGSWQAGKKGVIIYYEQDDAFDAVLEFLMRSLSETTLQLDKESVPLLASPQFQKEIEKLQRDRENRIIITPQSERRRIKITAITEDIDYTKAAVENFIQGNTIYTEVLKYSQPALKFMFLHCQDNISQDLKQFCVKFDFEGRDPSFGITLKATKAGIGQAKMFLKPFVEKVKCHQVVLTKVGISTFIESGDVLKQVEKNSRCVISKTADAADQVGAQSRSPYHATGKDNQDTSLNDVLFIAYPGDKESCQIFEAENQKHIEAMGGKVASTQGEIDAEQELDLENYRVELKANKDRRDNPDVPPPQLAADEGWLSGVRNWFSSKKSSSSDVTLWFYSDDHSNVQKAVDMIYKDMESKVQTKTVEEKTLKNWTTEQINKLQELEMHYGVTIKARKHLGRITISGLLNHLSDAQTHIYKMIRDVEKELQEKEYAEELKKVVQWYYIETDEVTGEDKPTPYDAHTNAKLERAFNGESRTQLIYGGYVFDFKKWVEYSEDDPSDQVTIMRKDIVEAASFQPPDTWEDSSLSVKPVPKGTPEYQVVEKNITDSFAGATLEIIRIYRVQNTILYQQYQAKRHQMENQNVGVVIEKVLWHGAKQDNRMNICNYGFNRSYCDKSQSTYGEGVYFTSTAPAAAQDLYAPADAQGKRYLFQSRVLAGSFTKGQSSFRVAPGKDPNKPTLLYDSVVDDPANPTTFVIFSDTQAYPEYLITIKC